MCALFFAACSTQFGQLQPSNELPACHIIYDAGSSETRLYIYQQSATGWLKHQGPRTLALADPVRGHRGRTMSGAGAVVDGVVTALEDIRHDGPVNENGKPQWPAFKWKKQCHVETVAVYATAGMRMAEQQDAANSELLWTMLNDRLKTASGMEVTTRTLTGFEEGLFAWLAKREGQGDGYFGVAEMGGASIQVTFPCASCETSRPVRVKGRAVPLFSHSFLGWGQDEAWKKFGHLPACQRGAGQNNPDWQSVDCAAGISSLSGVVADTVKNIAAAGDLRWYLSDAFRYMKRTDIENYCQKGIESSFQPVSACFRAVYLQKVLDTLGLPVESETSDVNWTLGAVVCTATRCLEFE